MIPIQINSDDAPAAVGPYSQSIKCDNYIFASGQLPLHPESGQIVSGGFKSQTNHALYNLEKVLIASGSSLDYVVKTTVYLTNMDNYSEFNELYTKCFGKSKPARTCIEVNRLPKNVLIEIDAIAVAPDK
ncbi:MAG: Rid family detoxifying hydrolase [Bacillota bacterium]|nr:Rid family detoxifying hydrolase [Bacillota bacterium]